MASFDEHLAQAKRNLDFLYEINGKSKYFDWQVTVCFYVGVHLVNAHLARVANLHYRTHEETKNAINPQNKLSTCAFDQEAYEFYISLEKLSRRARYLCNDGNVPDTARAYLTFEKHVSKAIKRLNLIMVYFNKIYGTNFDKIALTCPLVKAELPSLEFFP